MCIGRYEYPPGNILVAYLNACEEHAVFANSAVVSEVSYLEVKRKLRKASERGMMYGVLVTINSLPNHYLDNTHYRYIASFTIRSCFSEPAACGPCPITRSWG